MENWLGFLVVGAVLLMGFAVISFFLVKSIVTALSFQTNSLVELNKSLDLINRNFVTYQRSASESSGNAVKIIDKLTQAIAMNLYDALGGVTESSKLVQHQLINVQERLSALTRSVGGSPRP